ncbi:MAG: serine hydrolase [Oscillospiraceae bacterium]|nr:serine hydrolase [Oscillospiraceae bacterium]
MVTPEQRGIPSESIHKYIKYLEGHRFATHNVIIMRGDDIVFEKYWAPFHKDFLHRIYSATKSFTAIAVGFAVQDGLLELDAPMIKYFPEELKNQASEDMKNQTVRHMLMMSTAKLSQPWFAARTDDRVKFYFANDRQCSRPSGTIWQYDSSGSFVLGALVEKVTGKKMLDYLREKAFDKMGFSKEAYMLQCPGGWSWADSGLVCKATDLLKAAKLMLNGGRWNGEQLLNEDYVKAATGNQIHNHYWDGVHYETHGYGYLIWRTWQNSFMFDGMGSQFAVCVPDKDLIMVYNADNQGRSPVADNTIITGFFDIIVDSIKGDTLPENPAAQEALAEYTKDLKLITASGEKETPWTEKINGVTYTLGANDMGITKVRFDFDQEGNGKLSYTNAQGDKEISFGMGENLFQKFPQDGYSDQVGSQPGKGRFYDCAASAAWLEPHKLYVKVQIIDAYFGILNMYFSFRENKVGIYMAKIAEDFLNEYEGFAGGEAVQ